MEGSERGRRIHAIDRALLQLLAVECKEDHGEKALELCGRFVMPERALELARRVAGKYGRGVLGEKIGELMGGGMEVD